VDEDGDGLAGMGREGKGRDADGWLAGRKWLRESDRMRELGGEEERGS
jgi:hypothetical protein